MNFLGCVFAHFNLHANRMVNVRVLDEVYFNLLKKIELIFGVEASHSH